MADTEVYTHVSTAEASDGDTGWLDTSAVDELALDISVTAVEPPAGGFPNVTFLLERKGADGAVYQDWATQVIAAPHQENVGVGPALEVNRPVGDQTRLSWTVGGGSVTFAAGILGR